MSINFHDPNALMLNPDLLTLARQPEQPAGFWDKFKALNSGGKVLGMQPDEFAILMGSLAEGMMPEGNPIGGFGRAVAGFGTMRREQRLKDEDPEQMLKRAKTNYLLEGDAGEEGTVYAPGTHPMVVGQGGVSPTTLTLQPGGGLAIARRMGLWGEAEKGPMAQRKGQLDIQKGEQDIEKGGLEIQEKKAVMPFNIQSLGAKARSDIIKAEIAEQTKGADIESANLNPAFIKSHIAVNMHNARAPYRTSGGGDLTPYQATKLQLEMAKLNQTAQLANAAQLNDLTQQTEKTMSSIHAGVTKSMTRALPTQVGAIYSQAGKSLIAAGLQHVNMTAPYKAIDSGASKQVAARSIRDGINYYIQGVNQVTNVQDKVKLTQDLLRQIDQIAEYNPRMAQELEYEIFGPMESKLNYTAPSRYFWQSNDPKLIFDPYVVRMQHRGIKGRARRAR